MAITPVPFVYGAQSRRFLEQLVRAFSGFQYQTGWRNGNEPTLQMVPCRMAMRDRLIASIIRNNSENTLNTVPLITLWQTGLTFRREDLQNPSHIDTLQVYERAFDAQTGKYTDQPGNRYTVRRMMPLPFTMSVQLDLWTSNMEQKHQLIEQIAILIYPNFDIQNSDNAIDWSAKAICVPDDDMSWTSSSMPIGTESVIEVSTITMKIPMWLSPPAEVQQQRVIESIVTNIYDGQITTDGAISGGQLSQSVVTPGDHSIAVSRGVVTLLGPGGAEVTSGGDPFLWSDLFATLSQGGLRPTQTRLALVPGDNIEGVEIIGTLQPDSNDPSKLLWTIDPDTLPANTLAPVNAVLADPHAAYPGKGLPAVANGQRYLLLGEVSNSSLAWGALSASPGDIIQYLNGVWSVSFDASAVTTPQFVLNSMTSSQIKWTGETWVMAIDGTYGPGYWRIVV